MDAFRLSFHFTCKISHAIVVYIIVTAILAKMQFIQITSTPFKIGCDKMACVGAQFSSG